MLTAARLEVLITGSGTTFRISYQSAKVARVITESWGASRLRSNRAPQLEVMATAERNRASPVSPRIRRGEKSPNNALTLRQPRRTAKAASVAEIGRYKKANLVSESESTKQHPVRCWVGSLC